MSILKSLREQFSDFRAKVQGVGTEIDRLEKELKHLHEDPIRFDCWKAAQLKAIDDIAAMREEHLVRRWSTLIAGTDGHHQLKWPVERFASTREDAAPFYGARIPGIKDLPIDYAMGAGLEAGDMLFLAKDELKEAFSRIIDRARPAFPADSKCGLPMPKRLARIAEINTQLDKLRAERDEMLGVLADATSSIRAQPDLEAADDGEGGLRA